MTDERLPVLDHHLSFADGPETPWEVLSLRADEAINAGYRVHLELASEELELDAAELLGASCELALQRGEHSPSWWYGIVSRVDHLGVHDHRLRLHVEVVPALALAEQGRNSRIWQQQPVTEILAEVLAEILEPYGRSVSMDHLSRGSTPREYCVQYEESDLSFVKRLLEEEGISYHFVHDGEAGHEVLTLIDQNPSYAPLENVDGAAILPLIPANHEQAPVESIQALAWSQRLTTTAVARSDFDFQRPGGVSTAEHGRDDRRGVVRRVYTHGQRRLAGDDLDERVRDLAEALALEGAVARCESNASLARPGMRFSLEGHELAEHIPREWLIVQVAHHGGGGEGLARDPQHGYANVFECVPVEVPIRPLPHTPKPRVLGPQTATVVGGGEIDVDGQGRIQVQFHWQEDPSFSAGASCRVRCAQSWAGPGWGAQFIPRVGMEVVVEFLEGNPDRPLVTGCVYNGGAEPPFALPGNSTQSGIRSQSSPGGGGSNELRFEDAAGAEEIYIHGQKDWRVEIKHDSAHTTGRDSNDSVGHDRSEIVGNDAREAIGGHRSVSVVKSHSETIGGLMSLSVGDSQIVTVAQDQTTTVGASRAETVGASATETVTATKTVTVGAAMATIVGGAMNTSVGAACTEEVGGIKSINVGAASSESVVGGKSIDAATVSIDARKDLSLDAGQDASARAGKDLQIDAGGELTIHGETKGLLELGSELTIKVGKATITLKKSGEIVLDGTKISVKGKKSITLKSKKVNQN